MLPHPDGPESFCYDAVQARAFPWDHLAQLAVLRSLDVEHSHFDHDPAYAATCIVGKVSFERFLEHGMGDGVPAAVQAAVRDYLLSARSVGPSTWVSVDCEPLLAYPGEWTDQPASVWWQLAVATAPSPHPGFPGPSYAGAFDEQPGALRQAQYRMLVPPGQHTVDVHVGVRLPKSAATRLAVERLKATVDVTVAAGEHRALRCELDLAQRRVRLVDR